MAEDAIRLLDHLKIGKAHIVGYWMGALLTAQLLTTHPDRFATATLGGAGAKLADGSAFNQIADSLEEGKGFGPLVTLLTPPGQQPPPPEQVAAISEMILVGNDPLALAAVSRSLNGVHASEAKIVDALDGVLPHFRIVVIPGATHPTAPANPLFLSTLKAFLSEYPSAAKSAASRN